MTVTQADKLVDEYLHRLEQAAGHLQRSRRAELVAEIREHIETALRQEEEGNEVAVRNVLERLGPPEEIVEAAEPSLLPAGGRTGVLEIVALVALLVPLIGWLVGTVLVTVSRAWSRREKIVGVGPLLLLFLLAAVAAAGGGFLAGPEVLLLVLAGPLSAVYLGWRLGRPPAARRTAR